MRILYLTGSYFPSRRASSIQVTRMAGAFAHDGHDVTVIGKRSRSRTEKGVEDVFAYYGVPSVFRLLPLARPAFKGGGLLFRSAVQRFLRREGGTFDLLYCREPVSGEAAARLGLPLLFEAHVPPADGRAFRRLRSTLAAPGCLRLVTISEALLRHLRESDLVPESLSCVVAHDGAERALPSAETPPGDRTLQGRPGARIGYLGQLYPGKGADLVVALAAALPELTFHLVGGDRSAVEALGKGSPPSNLIAHGFVPPAGVPALLQELDIVLLPYGTTVHGATGLSDLAPWMSPLKMFEAMAAGKAIVASDLPVLREVLEHRQTAWLVPPGHIADWVEALRTLSGDMALRESLGRRARTTFETGYTWETRARRVLDGLAP